FDERSMAGLVLEGVPEDKVWNYACVGCLENTMQGNDRSGTVNCNPNLAKSIELTLWGGKSKFEKGKPVKKPKQVGPKTGDAEKFKTWDEFWNAWMEQIKFIIKYTVDVYNITEKLRADYLPTPYLSTIVRGCIEKGLDIRCGGPEIRFVTIEGVGFATTVDSLLAIKKFVYDDKKFTIAEIKEAILNNFSGKKEYEIMRSILANKAPKYGNNDDEADEMARKVMEVWSKEALKYKTPTNYRFRGGMLSWNYWAGEDAAFTPATPNGRYAGTFLSNAICPTNGADVKGPTAVANSVGIALGGKTDDGKYINYLPNGASHTITFNPSILRDPEHKVKFKAFLRGYIENGGSALQINILDAEMLRDAQKHPENYKNLLVRVTGYNAYFVAIGKELQDEIIARESHRM
ncbi:MAG: pyruvate formate lyase family protein, partial [Candidatus Helarchaeota archaeon]